MNRVLRWFVLSIAVLGPVAGTASRSEAAWISVNPTSDRTGIDTNSDGVADLLQSDDYGYLSVFGSRFNFRASLEFSLSPIRPGAVIDSATLFLYDGGTAIDGSVIQIHGYVGDGVVTLGSDFLVNNLVASYTVSGNQGHTLDVTSFLQGLANSGAAYAGFMLRSSVEGGFLGADIVSNEGASLGFSDSLRPTLTVNYSTASTIPEPASIAMVGLGMAGVGFVGRRQIKDHFSQ